MPIIELVVIGIFKTNTGELKNHHVAVVGAEGPHGCVWIPGEQAQRIRQSRGTRRRGAFGDAGVIGVKT
jgi:hypothetical protein